jgi:hypothetical protein
VKKLTLNADPEVIQEARRLARESGTSISSMFERFVRLRSQQAHGRGIGPLARKASGLIVMPKGKSDRRVLEDALQEKYGFE